MTNSTALIVEDDVHLTQIFSITLRSIGLDVHAVDDGQAALDYLAAHVPHLVLLDLHLPGANGQEILQVIRADERLANMPVILATADDRWGEVIRSEADLLLLKPISPEQLRTLAQRLLARHAPV